MASEDNASTSKTTSKTTLMNSLQNALRRKRKHEMVEESNPTILDKDQIVQNNASKDSEEKQEELKKKAKEIIVREAKRSAERASTMGPQGW